MVISKHVAERANNLEEEKKKKKNCCETHLNNVEKKVNKELNGAELRKRLRKAVFFLMNYGSYKAVRTGQGS